MQLAAPTGIANAPNKNRPALPMKTHILLTVVSSAALASSSFAGQPMSAPSKESMPPAPAPVYGTGFYLGLQGGANFYQDFGGTRHFETIRGNDIEISANQNIGFVGGLKAGYVFGTGTVRPAIEADLFYNGVRADLDGKVNGNSTKFNADGNLNSGAFMGNFLLRFAFDRFQPYLGAGAGYWVAQADDIDVTIAGRNVNLGSSSSNGGFAWQLVGGADYYWSEKFSTFLEYKFLNYEDCGINSDRVGQQIAVLGLRWHF
jgi:opacity protein-like surface antigen